LVSTFASVHGVEVGGGGLEQRDTRAGHGERGVQFVRLGFGDGVGEGEPELVVGQRDGAAAVGGVADHRGRRLEGGDRQRQHAAERRWVDGHRGGGEAAAGQDLGDQPAEGVPDQGRLLLEGADHVAEVIGDLPDTLAGEHLGVPVRVLDRVGIIGPAGREGGIARLLEHRPPAIPAAWQQPQPVDEHNRGELRGIGMLDLLFLVVGDV